jgi:hypothetical protein
VPNFLIAEMHGFVVILYIAELRGQIQNGFAKGSYNELVLVKSYIGKKMKRDSVIVKF